jgi:SlyX protein
MANDSDERLATLETRYAFLERHVAEQDRAMLEMAERIDRLEARVRHLQERSEQQGGEGGMPADERPPHY